MKQKRKFHEISDDEECNTGRTGAAIKENGENKRLKLNQPALMNCLDSEEEIWLLRMPIHLNPDELHNQKLNLQSKYHKDIIPCSSKDGIKRHYEPQTKKWKKDSNELAVLNQGQSGQFRLESFKCKGEINFVESIKVPIIGDIEVPTKEFVQPPQDLHRRHPFFGLNVPEEKLVGLSDKTSSGHQKKSKKSRKMNNSKDTNRGIVDDVELRDGVLNKIKIEPDVKITESVKKKKRKRKREDL